ncbi:hypothetical protein PFISCL1PPCAC_15550, partial [Pristionchus fissidentatus]
DPVPDAKKKAAYLIAYTSGQARDRLDELSDADRADFAKKIQPPKRQRRESLKNSTAGTLHVTEEETGMTP